MCPRRYPEAVHAEAIRRHLSGVETSAAIGKDLGISESVVRAWSAESRRKEFPIISTSSPASTQTQKGDQPATVITVAEAFGSLTQILRVAKEELDRLDKDLMTLATLVMESRKGLASLETLGSALCQYEVLVKSVQKLDSQNREILLEVAKVSAGTI